MTHLLKKYKNIIICIFCTIVVLFAAFLVGGDISEKSDKPDSKSETRITAQVTTQGDVTEEKTEKETKGQSASTIQSTTKIQSTTVAEEKAITEPTASVQSTANDKYQTDEIPQGKPKPVEPQEQEIKDNKLKCTVSISCASILDNMSELDEAKHSLVPNDGWILKPQTVVFNEGESAFDILESVCREKGIHLEFSFTPLYNSEYIEGINNIYEFDCGSLSGWRYSVNGWFPNYGSSRYEMLDGDILEFKYTCNYGDDIGANSF